jgi:hypothetical protein
VEAMYYGIVQDALRGEGPRRTDTWLALAKRLSAS